jgi:hypothetical protein
MFFDESVSSLYTNSSTLTNVGLRAAEACEMYKSVCEMYENMEMSSVDFDVTMFVPFWRRCLR